MAKCEKAQRPNDTLVDEFRERFPAYREWIDPLFRDDTDFDIDLDRAESLPSIPGYRLLERIAFGGMGVVYKAVQVGLDRPVAIKMVRGGVTVKDDELVRFRIEARAVAGIVHPHIVHIHDFGTFEGMPFFTMEYLDGGTLHQKLAAQRMGFREAATLIETLARALQVIHDRQIVHRDLKPGNILLTKDGIPKISDFGLAKRLGTDLSLTVSGMVMGTASYMAPEQARGDRVVTETVDIYALGAILYELLTGQPPFRDETYEKIIRRVTDEEPLRPREINADVPPELEAICLKCLVKEAGQRYLRATDLADDLRRYLNAEQLSIGGFDLVEQHERWAQKLGLDQLDLIGCTPFAFVYRAREKLIKRQVVLKLSVGPVGSAAHARLLRQAEAMAGLGHPNIEQLHVYSESGGQPYLIEEFIDGRNFSAVMRDRALDGEQADVSGSNDPSAEVALSRLPPRGIFSPVTARLAAEWVRLLARALQFVHENQVLHGAIYPGELRLTLNNVPKLCGFGAAQKIVPSQAPQEASASWVRPNYQPPEQVDGDWSAFSKASDIYSLGAVLYELLTGQAPFYGLDIQQTRAAVRNEVPIAPRNLNPRLPSALDWLCQRCLAKKPADRFESAAEIADALDRYLRLPDADETDTAVTDAGFNLPAPSGEFELRVFSKGQRIPVIFPLPRRWITIGRALESDIVIQDDYCSRHHCAIYWDDRTAQHVLVVIKAKHGVKINGESVRGNQALIPGDMIHVASATMMFSTGSPPAP